MSNKPGKTQQAQADGYLAGLQRDREEQREAEKLAREIEQREFRGRQAGIAREHSDITSLPAGSIEQKVAQAMLDAFPDAEPFEKNGKVVGRTEVARRQALDSLKGDDVFQTGRINFGAARARKTLRRAFEELKSSS